MTRTVDEKRASAALPPRRSGRGQVMGHALPLVAAAFLGGTWIATGSEPAGFAALGFGAVGGLALYRRIKRMRDEG